MKQNDFSAGAWTAILISLLALIISLLSFRQAGDVPKNPGATLRQLMQLATISTPDKGLWAGNVSPGLNHVQSAFGDFDYPADWGVPVIRTITFANELWSGAKWSLNFNPGGMGTTPGLEAYWHYPAANIYYPFDVETPGADPALSADAAFAGFSDYPQTISAPKACQAYKKLHTVNDECHAFTPGALFIDNASERIWFVASPVRKDGDHARYPGVTIHYDNTGSDFPVFDQQVKALIQSLRPEGTWDYDQTKIQETQ